MAGLVGTCSALFDDLAYRRHGTGIPATSLRRGVSALARATRPPMRRGSCRRPRQAFRRSPQLRSFPASSGRALPGRRPVQPDPARRSVPLYCGVKAHQSKGVTAAPGPPTSASDFCQLAKFDNPRRPVPPRRGSGRSAQPLPGVLAPELAEGHVGERRPFRPILCGAPACRKLAAGAAGQPSA